MKKDLCQEIWDISDEIISACGIDEHMTDIYLASPNDFLNDSKDWKKVAKKFKLEIYFDANTPIGLLALWIYEDRHHGKPLDKKKTV